MSHNEEIKKSFRAGSLSSTLRTLDKLGDKDRVKAIKMISAEHSSNNLKNEVTEKSS